MLFRRKILTAIFVLFFVFIPAALLSSCQFSGGIHDDDPGDTDSTSDSTSSDNSSGISVSSTLTAPYPLALGVDFPVAEGDFNVTSPFGPRILTSDNNRYDFHRGIDVSGITGQNIFSIATGTLYAAYRDGSSAFPNSGNVVIVRHPLNQTFTFQDQEITHVYVLYAHLDSFGTAALTYLNSGVSSTVNRGDIIGTMGQTGSASYTHLHLEVRLQTVCSLSEQQSNSSCDQIGFDPHVSPLTFLLDEIVAENYTISFAETSTTEVTVDITAAATSANVDGLVVAVYSDASLTNLIYEKTISFNTRESFDANSTTTLDSSTIDGAVISPVSYNSSSEDYQISMTVEIPDSVWESRSQAYIQAVLKTTHGNIKSTSTPASN